MESGGSVLPAAASTSAVWVTFQRSQAAFLDDAAGGDDLLVQAVAVADDHEAGVGDHGGGAQGGVAARGGR